MSGLTATTQDLYHGAAIFNFPIDSNVTKPRLEKQTSLVHICEVIVSIHYCYSIQGTRPRWRQHGKCI